jgi:tetratricopeptide (TPR) repeat protein
MNPRLALTVLETAGLVRPLATVPEPEYAFRHVLMQDSAYRLLLRDERERLHRHVGSAIESCYPQRTDELAALLANHFLLGGDRPRALSYLRTAAERARSQFANAEALVYYSEALEIADLLDQPVVRADLRRERGQTHEIVGDFEAARADYESALSLGQELHEPRVEWRATLDLGKLWAARDYEKTGEYFSQALQVARNIGDPEVIARSLNRIANWHINLGHPKEAKEYHREALEIFEGLGDQEGIAETLDFLGMTSMISSDVIKGAEYYERAFELFDSIGDKQRQASALTSYALRVGSTRTETVVGADTSSEQALMHFEEALEKMREIGWKSGESFALWAGAFLLNSLGRLDEALINGRESFDLARGINHTQWMIGASCALARTYLEMMDMDSAREHGERALSMAREMSSRHWIGISTGLSATVYLARQEYDEAEAVLEEFAEPMPGLEMLGDRLCWMAKAELLLARQHHADALDLLDRLIESAPGISPGRVITRLFSDRGRAYLGLGRLDEAREQLEAALAQSRKEGSRALQWSIHGVLARLEEQTDNPQTVREHLIAGASILDTIAESISDTKSRQRFQREGGARLKGNI